MTDSVLVEATSDRGSIGRGESCPRPYVTGETLDTARAFFQKHEASIREEIVDLASLRAWSDRRRGELEANPAGWCAIELALLDLLAMESGVTVEAFLGMSKLSGRFQYTAVLGDMGGAAFVAMAGLYRQRGFSDFKIKLSGDLDRDLAKVAVFRAWPDVRVRIDANNLWLTADEAIAFLRALDYPFLGVEEPIAAGQYEALARMAQELDCKAILDESFLRAPQMEQLTGDSDRWLINLRVSKMGGLLSSLAVVAAARAAGIGLVVGAQVGETSILTRAGLTVAYACRDLLIAQEGAFGTLLLERDICDPPLMFGPGGVLDTAVYPSLARPGFGLLMS